MYKQPLLVLSMSSLLIACGGNSDSSSKPVQQVPELNHAKMALTPLAKESNTSFAQHLKNGLYLRNSSNNSVEDQAETLATFSDGTSKSSASSSFSGTTVQYQGVDEGDRIKYDGQYLFIANQNYADYVKGETKAQASVRILQRESDSSLTAMADVVINSDSNDIDSIYLHENSLAVFSNVYSSYAASSSNSVSSALTTELTSELFFPTEQHFNLALVDVENPNNSQVTASYTIDGNIIDSRRVDNVLYVISSYRPHLDGLIYANTDEEKLSNYQKIQATNISDLLPSYTTANGERFPLVSEDNCYLPENATDKDGFDGVVTLTAIDMNNAQTLTSVCINTQVEGIYASASSVYLYGTDYQYSDEIIANQTNENKVTETSVIHKFAIDGLAINYAASGTVSGRFNWHMSNLRFSEYNDYLRVVTTSGNRREGFEHKLNVFNQAGNQLNLVAQLPNATQPTPIGKVTEEGIVQEDIKAVRFYGDLAYIVTFLTTDPLYIIDLTDAVNPEISGELEIPGYSAYLQPLSENLLLGIGQNVDPNQFGFLDDSIGEVKDDSSTNSQISPIVEGAKVSLYDVSDINSPQEISSIVYENGYTPAEFDYHALTSLKMPDGSFRIALPIERWGSYTEQQDEVIRYIWAPENFLALVEVSASDSNALLINKGEIHAKTDSETGSFTNYVSGWDDRAVFHQDDIYYIHGNGVWHSNWLTPEQLSGPF